jgi:hypothetical protein
MTPRPSKNAQSGAGCSTDIGIAKGKIDDERRPNPRRFRAKVFRDREHTGDWRVEKLDDDGGSISRRDFSAAAMPDSAPSGMNTATSMKSSCSPI